MTQTYAFWSPKGGQGCSTVAAAFAIKAGRDRSVALMDFGGDQMAIFGRAGNEPEWGTEIATNVRLWNTPDGNEAAALGDIHAHYLSRHQEVDVIVQDFGISEVYDYETTKTYCVIRGDYLALRRAMSRTKLLKVTDGLIIIEEPGRAIGAREASDVLGISQITRIPCRDAVARTIDAGVLSHRIPDVLGTPIQGLVPTLEEVYPQ